jgi:pimeloyl-ACP methyl ester carboxylesterase
MQDAVADLEAGLRQLGATHDLILVPHSFAGAISTYLAMRHPGWIAGAVLVDTNVPEFFTDEEVAHLAPIMLPMVAAELAAHPSKQTRTLNAITEAFVETSHDFHNAAWPASIPCVVIVSETSPFPETMKPEVEHWKQAHIDFAQKAPNRALITAAGSSHDIAHDRPKVIVDEVGKLVDNLRASTSGAPR